MSEFGFEQQYDRVLAGAKQRETRLLDSAYVNDEDIVIGFGPDPLSGFSIDAIVMQDGEKVLFVEEVAVLSEIGGGPLGQEHRIVALWGDELGDYSHAAFRRIDYSLLHGSIYQFKTDHEKLRR